MEGSGLSPKTSDQSSADREEGTACAAQARTGAKDVGANGRSSTIEPLDYLIPGISHPSDATYFRTEPFHAGCVTLCGKVKRAKPRGGIDDKPG